MDYCVVVDVTGRSSSLRIRDGWMCSPIAKELSEAVKGFMFDVGQ